LIAMMDLVNNRSTNIMILKGVVVEVEYGESFDTTITVLDKLILS
jgi:hypothetical protein